MTHLQGSGSVETIEVPPEVGELMGALSRADVKYRLSMDGSHIEYVGVMSFPDVDRFATAIKVAGYKASYSAGSGWKFAKDDDCAF